MNNVTRLCGLSGLSAMPKKNKDLQIIQIKIVCFFFSFFWAGAKARKAVK